jgi:hypothetical protein
MIFVFSLFRRMTGVLLALEFITEQSPHDGSLSASRDRDAVNFDREWDSFMPSGSYY